MEQMILVLAVVLVEIIHQMAMVLVVMVDLVLL